MNSGILSLKAIAALALLFFLPLQSCAKTQGDPHSKADAHTSAGLETGRAKMVAKDLTPHIEKMIADRAMPSITIVLFDKNRVLWGQAFGDANPVTQTPATLDTVYNTGSTFKFVVVTAIMQLVEQGKLSLDAPVNDYLTHKIPDFGPEHTPLTLRAMLAHRSGFPPSDPVPNTNIWSRTLPTSDEAVMANARMVEAPGIRYQYCNTCFAFYAEIIRNVTGQSIADYLRKNILLPAGVRYTDPFYPDAHAEAAMAMPYGRIGAAPWPISRKFLQVPYSGDAYERPLDMAKLLQVFLNQGRSHDGKLLKSATVQEMIPPQYDGNVSLGFWSAMEDGVRVLSWDGGIYGGSTVYQIEPATGIGVYIATNSNGTNAELDDLARRARELYRNIATPHDFKIEPVKGDPPVQLSAQSLGGLVGNYQIEGAQALVHIRWLGDQLGLTNPAGQRFELVMTGQAQGQLVSTGEQISFDVGADGKAASLVLKSGDAQFKAVRMQTEPKQGTQ